mgnify:CR=1 FL=1
MRAGSSTSWARLTDTAASVWTQLGIFSGTRPDGEGGATQGSGRDGRLSGTRPLASLRRFSPNVVVAAGGGIWSSPANIAALAARGRRGVKVHRSNFTIDGFVAHFADLPADELLVVVEPFDLFSRVD